MGTPVETEIKLLATPDTLARLRQHPLLAGDQHVMSYETTYFDTPGGALRRAGATLRVRTGGGGGEQTFKLPRASEPAVCRTEWTVPASGESPAIGLFPTAARVALRRLAGNAEFAPIGTSVIQRTTRALRFGHSRIEAAFDLGMIHGRERTQPLCELELELQDGPISDLLGLALGLPLGPDLQWSVAGKCARAQALAFSLPLMPIRAAPVELPPDATVGQGLRAIGWNGLHHLLANYPLVAATADPEAVHQTRVAVRRLRAALALFASGQEARIFAAELKAVAAGLAAARDLHLLHDRAARAAGAALDDHGALLTQLARRRDAALEQGGHLLASAPFQHLLVRFALWLEAEPPQEGAILGAGAFARAAARAVAHRHAKLCKGMRRLHSLSDKGRHRLRIAGKTLRYAAEFCPLPDSRVATARHRRRFIQTLQRLQDSLGELNDLAFAAKRRPALFTGCDPITAAGMAAELDGLIGPEAQSRQKLLKQAKRAFEALGDAHAWWRTR